MVEDLERNEFSVPANLQQFTNEVADIMVKIHTTNTFKITQDERADNVRETTLTPNENFSKKEFQDLWKVYRRKVRLLSLVHHLLREWFSNEYIRENDVLVVIF